MSYWVYLELPGALAQVERFEDGGTYVLGGTVNAELNVTYNYSAVFKRYSFSLRELSGKRAQDTINTLELLTKILPNEPDPDYWKATRGNAGAVIHRLLRWAHQHPDAIWRVS